MLKLRNSLTRLWLHSLRDACGTQLGLAVKARLLSLLKEPVYSQRHRQSGVAGQRGLRQIRFMQGGLIQCGIILGGGEGDPELCQRDRRWGRCGGDWAWGYLATCADATDQCAAAGRRALFQRLPCQRLAPASTAIAPATQPLPEAKTAQPSTPAPAPEPSPTPPAVVSLAPVVPVQPAPAVAAPQIALLTPPASVPSEPRSSAKAE